MRLSYGLAALAIFLVEIGLALFVRDGFFRPYIGDVLAIAFVYCALRTLTPLGLCGAVAAALLIATAIELAQLFNVLDAMGLRGNAVIRTVLGGSFDLLDFAAYAAGAALVWIAETLLVRGPDTSP